jgi:hypothetical protein
MNAVESSPMSMRAGAPERGRRTNFRQSLRAMRDNAWTAHAPEDFSADIIVQRILWRRMFVINRWSQRVDATLASNLSAGVSIPKALRGRSLS